MRTKPLSKCVFTTRKIEEEYLTTHFVVSGISLVSPVSEVRRTLREEQWKGTRRCTALCGTKTGSPNFFATHVEKTEELAFGKQQFCSRGTSLVFPAG